MKDDSTGHNYPKKIYAVNAWQYNVDCHSVDNEFDPKDGPKYIRSDIVELLKGYCNHDLSCPVFSWTRWKEEKPCTCGLTDLLKELQQ